MVRKITEISSLWTFPGDFLISVHSIIAVSLTIHYNDCRKIKGGVVDEAEVLPCAYN